MKRLRYIWIEHCRHISTVLLRNISSSSMHHIFRTVAHGWNPNNSLTTYDWSHTVDYYWRLQVILVALCEDFNTCSLLDYEHTQQPMLSQGYVFLSGICMVYTFNLKSGMQARQQHYWYLRFFFNNLHMIIFLSFFLVLHACKLFMLLFTRKIV